MAQTKIKAAQFSGVIGNGTSGYVLQSSGNGDMEWVSNIVNPTVLSVAYPGDDTAADPAGGQTVTITGIGFKTGANVTIGGTAASSVSFVSATTLTITTPAKAAGDYDIVVTNTDTGTGTKINAISYNGIPAWTTAAGSLGTFASDTTISTITLQASEPDAGTITFDIISGTLPTGLSLTGANIDGTTSLETADTLYNFTIEAIDDENQATARAFSITVTKQFLNIDNFTINTYAGTGSTQSIEGKIGTAASFNGSSSYIDVSNLPMRNIFDSIGEFSISLWVYVDSFVDFDRILDFNKNFALAYYPLSTGKIQFNTRQSDGTAIQFQSSTTFSTNTWYHISATYDSSNVKLYVNGSLDTTQPYNGTIYNGTDVNFLYNTFGVTQRAASAGGNLRYFKGKLDQVRIFDKAISSSEVTTLYGESNTSTTKSTTDIFDDGSGVALYEFENGAKDTGSYRYGTGAIDSGQSAVFNGGSSYIETTNNFGLSGNVNFTLSCWIKVDSLITGRMLDMWNGTIANNNCIFFQLVNGRLAFDQYAETYISGTDINVGVWNHVAFTRQTNNVGRFYINGVEIDSHTYSSNINLISDPLIIGKASNNAAEYYFDGSIDQVRIYSSALSASDIEALASETNVPTANLVAHYKLDGNANDETGTYNGITSNITYSGPAEFPLVAYNGTPTNVSFVGTSFQPDLVWIKNRNATYNHAIYDSVRGAEAPLFVNTTSAEDSDVGDTYGLKSFDSNGFTLGYNGAITNTSGNNFVAWCWKAASSDSANTDGTITSTVRANQAAGFSIVKYTGTGAIASVGHGLSQAPEMIIIKNIDNTVAARNWAIYHSGIDANPENYFLRFTTESKLDYPIWNDTAPSSTVFTLGDTSQVGEANDNNNEHIAYCFHSVDGYQKIGSYTGGTGEVDVTTGFKPRWVMIKNTSNSANWVIFDSIRSGTTNPINDVLEADTSDIEAAVGTAHIDIVDNGFQVNNATSFSTNNNGDTYIYLAIA